MLSAAGCLCRTFSQFGFRPSVERTILLLTNGQERLAHTIFHLTSTQAFQLHLLHRCTFAGIVS